MSPGLGNDLAQVSQTVHARCQRLRRLVLQRSEMFILRRDVGRVRDDQIKTCWHTLQPGALLELHRELQAPRVGACDVERIVAAVEGADEETAALPADQTDGAAEGAPE